MDVFERLNSYMKVKGLYLQATVQPTYFAENEEHFLSIVLPYMAKDTNLSKQSFWRGLDNFKRSIACRWLTLMVDPGYVSFDVPSHQASIFIVISGRAAVEIDYGEGVTTRIVAGMGGTFGALNLFDDPLGRKRKFDPSRPPLEVHVTATMIPGSNLLRMTIVDYLRKVVDSQPNGARQGQFFTNRPEFSTRLSFLNPLRGADSVTQALKPSLPIELFDFLTSRHLLPTFKEQMIMTDPTMKQATDRSGVLKLKQYTKLVFNFDEMPAVAFVVMEGTVRVHVERKITSSASSSSSSASFPASSSDGQKQPRATTAVDATTLPTSRKALSGRDQIVQSLQMRKVTQNQPTYVGGKQISIGTKILPICDFDVGSVVYLREHCFNLVQLDISDKYGGSQNTGSAGGGSSGGNSSGSTHHGPETTNAASTTATHVAPLVKSSSIHVSLHTIDPAATSSTATGTTVSATATAITTTTSPTRVSVSLPHPGSATSLAAPIPPIFTSAPYSRRKIKNASQSAYDIIFECPVGTTVVTIPTDMLNQAIRISREEVKNRQSTDNIKAITKLIFRSEALVYERLTSLESWLQGEGVTVNRKKTHVVTMKEIRHRKHWCFDNFAPEPIKQNIRDVIENDERLEYEHMRAREQLRLDMQNIRKLLHDPVPLTDNQTGGVTDTGTFAGTGTWTHAGAGTGTRSDYSTHPPLPLWEDELFSPSQLLPPHTRTSSPISARPRPSNRPATSPTKGTTQRDAFFGPTTGMAASQTVTVRSVRPVTGTATGPFTGTRPSSNTNSNTNSNNNIPTGASPSRRPMTAAGDRRSTTTTTTTTTNTLKSSRRFSLNRRALSAAAREVLDARDAAETVPIPALYKLGDVCKDMNAKLTKVGVSFPLYLIKDTASNTSSYVHVGRKEGR